MVLGNEHDRTILLVLHDRWINMATCAVLAAALPGGHTAQDVYNRAVFLRSRRDSRMARHGVGQQGQGALEPDRDNDDEVVNAARILTGMQREERRAGAERRQEETGAELARGGVPSAVLAAAWVEMRRGEVDQEEEEE